MIYDSAVDKNVLLYVGGRKFWNAYRVDTETGRVNYIVNESGDPFDEKSPLKLLPRRRGLARASIVVPKGQLKVVRDRSR